MHDDDSAIARWTLWLRVASAGVAAFGLVLVLAPAFTRHAFSLMLYALPGTIDGFGAEPVRYVSLTHAVLGGVMVGWGVALFHATKTLFPVAPRATWNLIAGSLAAWFVPDTAYSLASGFWPNAVLNAGFAALFAVPLWGLRSASRRRPWP